MLLAFGTFTLAAMLIVLLPGPDTLVVVRNLVRGGRASAVRTVLGVLSGLTVWVVTAALGLSAVLRASHDAYFALRIVGAAYLVWIGVQSLRSRGASVAVPEESGDDVGNRSGDGDGRRSAGRRGLLGTGYLSGLTTDLLNPKVGVFFVTFLPGFVPHGQSVGWMSLALGAIFVGLTALYFGVLLVVSAPVTRWMSTAHIRRRLDRGTGVVLVAFGIRLALD